MLLIGTKSSVNKIIKHNNCPKTSYSNSWSKWAHWGKTDGERKFLFFRKCQQQTLISQKNKKKKGATMATEKGEVW